MTQKGIPYFFIRGGSSRGPYFNAADLPADRERLAQILIAVVGSGHPLNIDGIGGGNAVTTKVAILSPSQDNWADVDYLFAQVSVENRLVDFKPTCGNIMIGVGPAAIEMGLVKATEGSTTVRVHAVNTGARVEAIICTPNGEVSYDGNTTIDGVPGSAAPVAMDFRDVAGSSTGKLLPTGNARDLIDGISVSCVDFAMPMVIAHASEFGLSGHETREELDANKAFFARMEKVRLKAALHMGMGDCSTSVTPKFGLVAQARSPDASMSTRYFMPWTTHPTLAVTGSQCLCACASIKGSVADEFIDFKDDLTKTLTLEHPLGSMNVVLRREKHANVLLPVSAGVIRTARKIAQGEVFVAAKLID